MTIRKRMLPSGWYPQESVQVQAEIASWDRADRLRHDDSFNETPPSAVSAIAPHAGWYFSGSLSWRAWKAARDADIVVIAGGHIPPGQAFRFVTEDQIEVPSGIIPVDRAILDAMMREFPGVPETGADNTVEVQLPLCATRFQGRPVLAVRIPNDARAIEVGVFLFEWAKKQNKRMFVLGSTDLTHYGDAYGFQPAGEGSAGLDWAKKNDDAITAAFCALDFTEALRLGNERQAACSVGAALCAMSFARENGVKAGTVLGSDSSYRLTKESMQHADSFVGYAAVAFPLPEAVAATGESSRVPPL